MMKLSHVCRLFLCLFLFLRLLRSFFCCPFLSKASPLQITLPRPSAAATFMSLYHVLAPALRCSITSSSAVASAYRPTFSEHLREGNINPLTPHPRHLTLSLNPTK
jgi:hypothetical protein